MKRFELSPPFYHPGFVWVDVVQVSDHFAAVSKMVHPGKKRKRNKPILMV